jgi:hypothetical protein
VPQVFRTEVAHADVLDEPLTLQLLQRQQRLLQRNLLLKRSLGIPLAAYCSPRMPVYLIQINVGRGEARQ